jgi:enterochelin esterase-like enzyme
MLSLTGRGVLVLLLLMTVAAPIAGLRLWSMWNGRGRTAIRLGLFAVAQLSAVALTAAAANDYGSFYPSWSDLFAAVRPSGNDAGTTVQGFGAARTHAGSKVPIGSTDLGTGDLSATQAKAIAGALQPDGTPDKWATDGAVVRFTVPDDTSRQPQTTLAYLPPSYFSGSPDAAALPVVEVLTGYPGSPQVIVDKLDAVSALRAGLANGTLSPMVLVMTRPVEPWPRDTECMDIPNGPQTLRYLSSDLPHVAAETLHLSVANMGVIGFSSGGYCALKLAMTHPETFVGAASMSGYYSAEPGAATGDLFGTDSTTVREQNDLDWRLNHLPIPDTSVLLATARDETGPDGYKAAQKFLGDIRIPMSAQEMVREHGGHNFGTWAAEFPGTLQWMDQRLAEASGHKHHPAANLTDTGTTVSAAAAHATRITRGSQRKL